jgi:hypothetical protein
MKHVTLVTIPANGDAEVYAFDVGGN